MFVIGFVPLENFCDRITKFLKCWSM